MGNTRSTSTATSEKVSLKHGSQEKPSQPEKGNEEKPKKMEMEKFPIRDSLPEIGFGQPNRPGNPADDKSGFFSSQENPHGAFGLEMKEKIRSCASPSNRGSDLSPSDQQKIGILHEVSCE